MNLRFVTRGRKYKLRRTTSDRARTLARSPWSRKPELELILTIYFRRGICEAIMPLLSPPDRKLLYKSGLMIPDVRTREATWKTGAGTMKISGRKTKKWRKR